MPLLDHFHAPLLENPPWSSISTLWIAAMVASLNKLLPRDQYRAIATSKLGGEVEADIAEYEYPTPPGSEYHHRNGGLLTLAPPAVATVDAVYPDEFEVQIRTTKAGMAIVAAIELVSPSNSDRPEARHAFTSKCLTYLYSARR